MSAVFAQLEDRGILEIAGLDRKAFLQGLVSNDVQKLGPHRALYAAFLTPQGKYLHDFFLVEQGEVILLEGERARLPDLLRRLSIFKLRSKATLADVSDRFSIAVAFGAAAGANGARPLEAAGLARAEPADYDRLRLSLGVADGSRDLVVEKAILLEAGFDELHGVDWDKGCYMGQELTARTKYRALIKKRLIPVQVQGQLPEPGTIVKLGEQEAGEIRSGRGDLALALLRLEAMDEAAKSGTPLLAGATQLTPVKPAWARF